ncbi:TetR/AcrR family transcriptional regulator [Paenibacillus wynnii]|uniref:TetR/AcrR family transcriptional regulator n=1 Tax=Paenibacillus wynnii TaxID=268407 RepID=UPI0027906C15|nr:TetR/AcrR family transcriptional regulator [Paenibacillus wynnii]MDQ0196874.1 TetR/AcrR family transcriptional repressor of nem operon [Paenibacillus wynnii]
MTTISDPNISVKKGKLLDAALSLMLSKGYHGTTVDEICAEAGVTKGSFFYYFKSKEDAGKATLDHFERLQSHLLSGTGWERIADPWEKLNRYLDVFALMAKNPDAPNSCLTALITQEMAESNAEFCALCEEKLAGNAKPLKDILDEVIAQYPPQSPVDSQQLADYFLAVYQGSLILAKARRNRAVLGQNVEHFRMYVTALFHIVR